MNAAARAPDGSTRGTCGIGRTAPPGPPGPPGRSGAPCPWRGVARGVARTLAAAMLVAAALAPGLLRPATAQALDVGGLTLQREGFADVLLASQGLLETNAANPALALTDADLATWVRGSQPGSFVRLGFTDNRVLNAPGDDIALFEVGHEAYEYSQEGFDSLWVTINGQRRLYFTTETTTIVDDHNVNMTRLDLSHFGVAEGALVDQLEIGLDYDTRGSFAQLQLVAAIHSVPVSVPEPGSAALLLLGAAALLSRRWGRRAGRAGLAASAWAATLLAAAGSPAQAQALAQTPSQLQAPEQGAWRPPRARPVAVPVNLQALGDRLLFTLEDAAHGQELWRLDSPDAEPVLVADIRPGPLGSHPSQPVRFGAQACFAANDGRSGFELWCSDGSAEGTRQVADIRPGAEDSVPGALTPLDTPQGPRLLFVADDGVHGFELWVSDGTAAGTRLLADIQPGAAGSNPRELLRVGAQVFFVADDGRHGAELWVTDGSAAGTRLVRDLNPGPAASGPGKLTAWSPGGRAGVAFVAHDGRHGAELWFSDGRAAGTRLVADVNPGPAPSRPAHLARWGRHLYFAADDGRHGVELWRSDGRARGTRLVKDLFPGPGHGLPAHLTVAAGALHFAATDGRSPVRLWRSDGRAAGTRPVVPEPDATRARAALAARAQPGEQVPRQPVPGGEVPNRLTADVRGTIPPGAGTAGPPATRAQPGQPAASRLLYAAMDDAHGYELWASDGSAAGTRLLADLSEGPGDGFPHAFTRVGAELYFLADDRRGLTGLWVERADGRIQRLRLPGEAQGLPQAGFPAEFPAGVPAGVPAAMEHPARPRGALASGPALEQR